MSDPLDWNAKTIAEFRANQGRVGGVFEGAPLVLVHHRGRKSGREYVNPMMYLPHDTEPDIIYVFATRGGAPTNPDWYYNLTAAAIPPAVPTGGHSNPSSSGRRVHFTIPSGPPAATPCPHRRPGSPGH